MSHPELTILVGLGLLLVFASVLARKLRGRALSAPMIFVALGFVAFLTPWIPTRTRWLADFGLGERAAEFVVLVALMGAGLKIDRPFSLGAWALPARLLGLAMPLTIIAMAAGASWAGYPLGEALLIGAMLSPTDPVLASDVEAAPPGAGRSGDVRFALTAEAGLNDGLAFPVVMLAAALQAGAPITGRLLAELFILRLGLSVAAALAIGWCAGWLVFRAPKFRLADARAGPVAIGLTLVAYGTVQLLGGYGFVAVFVTAVTLRASCRGSPFHAAMVRFAGEIEHMVVLLLLLLFGGALASGLLSALEPADAALGLALVFVVRPVSGWVSLIGSPSAPPARLAMAFFGVRGVGTLFYLLYGLRRGLAHPNRISALVGFVVLVSLVVHGAAAGPAMRGIQRLHDRNRRSRAQPRP